jgi:hypothetical protein
MDLAYIPALAAVSGSASGALATVGNPALQSDRS